MEETSKTLNVTLRVSLKNHCIIVPPSLQNNEGAERMEEYISRTLDIKPLIIGNKSSSDGADIIIGIC